MEILFIGASGLLGSHLSNLIIKEKIDKSNLDNINFYSIQRNDNVQNLSISSKTLCEMTFKCDCRDIDKLTNILKNISPDIIVNLAQINLSRFILSAIKSANIKQPYLITVGSLRIFSKYSKVQDYQFYESLISNNINKRIIIRPSMIYGNKYDRNMHKLINFIRSNKFVPIILNGNSKFQPVFYQDISLAIFKILKKFFDTGIFNNAEYNLSGPDILSLKEICFLIAKKLTKKIYFINIPIKLIFYLIKLLELLKFIKLPIKSIQILRLHEDKVFKSDWDNQIIQIVPTNFRDGINSEINSFFDNSISRGETIFKES